VGYAADVSCIYNSSTEFVLQLQPSDPLLVWQAMGTLPNSNGFQELSMYFGRDDGPAIVAIGVASLPTTGLQYLGIAAGEDYKSLNQTQCAVNFVPTLFNVTVDTTAGNLTVIPVSSASDIDPSGNITHTAIRQMELIANDQTNLYQSLLGSSFFESIGDYIVSQASLPSPPSTENATLSGLQNSVAAMLDDILAQYASAQLMVGNQSAVVEAQIMVASMQIGQRVYVIAEVVINIIVLLLVLGESVRTRGWRGLVEWDYMNVRCLVVGSFKGGRKREGVESRCLMAM
jgi:hypothetical protein